MEIPENISKVGWYKYGAAPGSNGGSVIFVSHRDGMGPEPGAFYKLETLQMGNEVVVHTDQYTVNYIINDLILTKKSNLLKKSHIIFDKEGPPKLIMITCGGPFNFKKGEYTKNVIVIAIPIKITHN